MVNQHRHGKSSFSMAQSTISKWSKLLIYQIWWLWHRDCNNALLVDMAMDSSLIYQRWWASIVYQRVYYAELGLLNGSRKLLFFFCVFFFFTGFFGWDVNFGYEKYDGHFWWEYHRRTSPTICQYSTDLQHVEQHPHLSSDGYMINPHLYHHNLAG